VRVHVHPGIGGGAYHQITAPASQAVESSYFGTSVPWAYPAKFKKNIKILPLLHI
jgi:hypothetical protein